MSEAKNGLSALIARVASGESITIVDRGRPVAILSSPVWAEQDVEGRLLRLQRRGLLRLGSATKPDLDDDPPSTEGASVVDALLDDRAGRP